MILRDMVQYAYDNSDFYHKLYDNICLDRFEITELPIVTKNMLRICGNAIVSKSYTEYPMSEDITQVRSSGSTGEYLNIYWDRNDRVYSLYDSWKWRMKHFNIYPNEKFISFYSSHYINNRFVDDIPGMLRVDKYHTMLSKLNLNKDKIDKYIEFINEYQPTWMLIQPSIMTLITMRIEETKSNFPDSLKYVEFTGEYISNEQLNYLSKKYQIQVANNYGCNETNFIACSCEYGYMHVLSNNVYVEIDAKESTEYGNILVTSLHNKAMPFIRYNTGDVGKLKCSYTCKCGCTSPILELLGGRSSQKIYTRGEIYSSAEIIHAVEKTNSLLNHCIKQYQCIQHNDYSLEMKFVISSSYINWKESITDVFMDSLESGTLKELRINIKFEDEIYPDKVTGKLSAFISEVEISN
jgi:phenylacetate-CoA ligase